MQVILLVVILSVISQAVRSEGQKLCGRNLSITLAALCRAEREKQLGQYATSQKRSRYNSILPYYEPYWLEPESALRLRGKRDGIVEECCNKACAIDELLAYCPPIYQ